jgi:hypothetical protein
MSSSQIKKSLLLALPVAMLAGCALQTPAKGEDLRQQTVPSLEGRAGWANPTSGDAVADGWLAAFDDAELQQLVRKPSRTTAICDLRRRVCSRRRRSLPSHGAGCCQAPA